MAETANIDAAWFGLAANLRRPLWLLPVVFFALAMAGCGGGSMAGSSGNSGNSGSSNATFSVSPGTASIDTNCTGCNAGKLEQFSATLNSGGAAAVTWSLPAGGGYGSINASTGQYTPPSYLTADSLQVPVTATLNSNPSVTASATLTVTPGFLQPLSPENMAVGASGAVQVTGYIAEAGGSTGVAYSLASAPNGSSGGQGSLSAPICTRSSKAFTFCTVSYTAPAAVGSTSAVYIVATVGSSKESTVVLLNSEGINSSPVAHELQLGTPMALGSSGGSNTDYDTKNGSIADCCGGTLGALVQGSDGKQYILSNNHVLARSDQAAVGDAIVQPGLIDDGCTPYGQTGATVTPVGTLTGWVPIKSAAANVDAAIAQVNSGAVNASGAILELGAKQANGALAAAPPGISSTAGKGETAAIGLTVAKSGRTTGLTCASVSAVNLNVQVSYFSDCGETIPYYTKTFTNQVGITGNQFSDAGDSGSLVVDAGNAEPVGLFFAGGQNSSGVGEGVANPVSQVLSELSTYAGNGSTTFTVVGGADHAVSCLNYGNATASAAQAVSLSDAEQARAEGAMTLARSLVNPAQGIFGVVMGKSSDRVGEASVIVYVDPSGNTSVPATVDGVRTTVIPVPMQAVANGTAPRSLLQAGVSIALPVTALRQGIAIKDAWAPELMRNPAFFGVGVGQSYDNPRESALVVYVDRTRVPASLPATVGGLRARYVVMERLHVTRSYLSPTPFQSHCVPHAAAASRTPDFIGSPSPWRLNLF